MAAYVVIPREKTRNQDQLDHYKKLAPASFERYPTVFRANKGRHEVLEASAIEDIIVLEFPSYEEAEVWHRSPPYQAGGEYRSIFTGGVAAK
jgi:uncharacterized protein (DUF1330 family)